MKLITLLAVASATIITANAGGAPRSYYKVKINAEATLQTDIDDTSGAKVTTNDVIVALIDELGVPSSRASDFDIIACYEGDDDDILDEARYYLARTRGPVDSRYKVEIPDVVFDTGSGESVYKRVFTPNSTTVKVSLTDAYSRLVLDTSMLYIDAQGLTKAKVTIKDFSLGGGPYLDMVSASLNGHHVIETEDADGVGSINAKIAGPVKTETFDDLQLLLVVNPL